MTKKADMKRTRVTDQTAGYCRGRYIMDMLLVIAREPKFHALIVSLELYSVPDI